MTTHDYKTIAAIVGADKIDALRDAGVPIADKPTKPTTDLFGRWAIHPVYGGVLITSQHPDEDGWVMVSFLDVQFSGKTDRAVVGLDDLTFPEETTRPEDVPVGEAWLVNADDRYQSAEGVTAFKINNTSWVTGDNNGIIETEWENHELELITPLIPARPHDIDRERAYWEQQTQIDGYERDAKPETVTTEEEYAALPEGSIVAFTGGNPWFKDSDGKWGDGPSSVASIACIPRQVLRRGWGE